MICGGSVRTMALTQHSNYVDYILCKCVTGGWRHQGIRWNDDSLWRTGSYPFSTPVTAALQPGMGWGVIFNTVNSTIILVGAVLLLVSVHQPRYCRQFMHQLCPGSFASNIGWREGDLPRPDYIKMHQREHDSQSAYKYCTRVVLGRWAVCSLCKQGSALWPRCRRRFVAHWGHEYWQKRPLPHTLPPIVGNQVA